MKNIRATSPLLLAVALAWAPCATTRADEATSQISFSDPSKPGTLKVRVWHGDVSVRGGDVKEITVKSDSTSLAPTPRKDGMRVLSTSSSFLLSEKDNVAVLEYGGEGWAGGSADFEITVPRSTSVIVSNSAHGELSCSGLSGDIDVRTMSGDVKLEDVTGGALVETMNGEIGVDIKSLSPSRPLSFTSMHGEITIHLPSDSKANILFRTHRGVIMSNFDDKALVTKTEIAHKASQKRVAPVKAVSPTSPDSPPAISADAPPKPIDDKDLSNGEEARSSDSDRDWHNDVSASIKQAAEEAALAAHEAAEAVREGLAEAHVQISGVFPPLPPMTGGKVVTGTLNGGGTQIQAATLSGDILLKKAD